MMEVTRTAIEGLLILQPRVFADERGCFLESFNERAFQAATGVDQPFVQDNESVSAAGVLRGLHYQAAPHAQGKLVHVGRGAVLDVCVDLRPGSSTYGHHVAVQLTAERRNMLWIPAGFAHGFLAQENDTLFLYKCTAYYHPAAERTLRWDDPELGIDWGATTPLVSAKDAVGHTLREHQLTTRS